MNLWSRIWTALRGETPGPPIVETRPVAATPGGIPAAARRGRPASPALLKTIELVRRHRTITPREIADQIGVSSAYARTLLRRAQAKVSAPVAIPTGPVRSDIEATVAKLHNRIEEAEQTLAGLRSIPPQARASWNLHRRAEVLRLSEAGAAPAEIAGALSIPPGEVEFILKVNGLLQTAAG